jgi:hypothetical protein
MFQLAQPAPKPSSGLMPVVGALLFLGLLFVVIFSAGGVAKSMGATSSTDLAPTTVDGKKGSTVSSTVSGSNTSLQFWMYIADWTYKYGQPKNVISQTSSTSPGTSVPAVVLHPTDNALDINVSVYPGDNSALLTSDNGSGAKYTATIENVPLQSWFAVSISIAGRAMDVYINGQLHKSVTLPGVPMPASGSIIIGGGGGFSGSVCTVHSSSISLLPADATGFFTAGTACSGTTITPSSPALNNLDLFGYTFTFGVTDSAGKKVSGLSSSDVSGWFSSSTQ